jgi:hypothetical protein
MALWEIIGGDIAIALFIWGKCTTSFIYFLWIVGDFVVARDFYSASL